MYRHLRTCRKVNFYAEFNGYNSIFLILKWLPNQG